MKLRQSFILIMLSLSSCVSLFSQELVLNQGVLQAEPAVATTKSNASIFSGIPLFDGLNKSVEDFKNLEYETAQSLRAYTALGKVVEFNWGFAGAGDMFAPLRSVVGTEKDLIIKAEKPGFFAELGQALVQDQVIGHTGKVDILASLVDKTMMPQLLFTLKVVLLAKHVAMHDELSLVDRVHYFKREMGKLLTRLALTSDVQIFTGAVRPSQYLPQAVIDMINIVSPDTVSFIDRSFLRITNCIGKPHTPALFDPSSQLFTVYQFNDAAFASAAHQHLLSAKEKNGLVDRCEIFVADNDGEIAAMETVKELQDGASDDEFVAAMMAKIVGKKTVQAAADLAKAIGAELSTEQNNVLEMSKTLLVGGKCIIVARAEQTPLETIEDIMATLLGGLKEYVQVRDRYLNSHPEVRLELDNAARRAAALVEFTQQDDDGKASADRLTVACARAYAQFDQSAQGAEVNNELAQCSEEVAALEAEHDALTQRLADNKALAGRKPDEYAYVAEYLRGVAQAMNEHKAIPLIPADLEGPVGQPLASVESWFKLPTGSNVELERARIEREIKQAQAEVASAENQLKNLAIDKENAWFGWRYGAKIAAADKKKKEALAQIAVLEASLVKLHQQHLVMQQSQLDQEKKNIERKKQFEEIIATCQEQLTVLENKLAIARDRMRVCRAAADSQERVRKQLTLNKLLSLLTEQKQKGQLQQELQDHIAQLEKELAAQPAITDDGGVALLRRKLQVRRDVAAIYEEEAAHMQGLLNAKIQLSEGIATSEEDRIAARFQFAAYKDYIASLHDRAQLMTKQNKKLNKLIVFKKESLAGKSFAPRVSDKMAAREQELAPIIENDEPAAFCATEQSALQSSMLNEFLLMMGGGNQKQAEPYKELQKRLMAQLKGIVRHSPIIRGNKASCKHILKTLMPNAQGLVHELMAA